jgi:HlyD family secretion protein
VREAQRQLAEAQRRSAESQALHDTTAVVTAAATGTVAEIQANPGARIAAGQNLLTIETGEDRLELLLFAAPADGDRIKPGMAVLVSPSQVPREEFGTLSGTVATVSELPTTTEGMKAILHNDELIRGFQRSGVPFLVRVALEADPQSVSGYRWSSRRGRSITLSSGTLASGEITIRRQAPITLLIPLLRRNTGL